jgi:hypothetical protein
LWFQNLLLAFYNVRTSLFHAEILKFQRFINLFTLIISFRIFTDIYIIHFYLKLFFLIFILCCLFLFAEIFWQLSLSLLYSSLLLMMWILMLMLIRNFIILFLIFLYLTSINFISLGFFITDALL